MNLIFSEMDVGSGQMSTIFRAQCGSGVWEEIGLPYGGKKAQTSITAQSQIVVSSLLSTFNCKLYY